MVIGMNILVITPLYYIQGRPNLLHDTSAIHYLIRPWAAEYNVLVVNVYFESLRKIKRYISKEERTLRKGYEYTVDGVKVGMIEVLKPYKQRSRLTVYEAMRVKRYIKEFADRNSFLPDIIVTHIPITVINAVCDIYPNVPKYAVLHTTDRTEWKRNKRETQRVRDTFDAFFVRSKNLYDFFKNQELKRLRDEILFSGGKKADGIIPKRHENVGLMYAGKLIAQKNVDIIIKALSFLEGKYKFVFEIYGDGSEREKLQELARKSLSSNSYRFMGKVSHEEVLNAMARNDFFVMVSKNECFGLTYVEAMVNNCIPIGTTGEGIDGIIKDGINGFLVKADDVEALKEKLEECFKLSDICKREIEHSICECSKTYSEESAARHYLKSFIDEYIECGYGGCCEHNRKN